MIRIAALLLLAHAALASDVPALRLVHLDDGIRGDLEKSPIFKYAQRAGVDLRRWREPLLVHAYREGRLFYVFYKTTENALADRPYLIQRIRKTERTWPKPDAKPEVRVTYQVEVFKTIAGALKRADQHYGSFGLRDSARREIVKEYEIGFGEVPGKCEGAAWPYAANTLFHTIQPYQTERDAYDEVRFHKSRTWSLRVEFDRDGNYRVASEELGFDAPERLPAKTRPTPDPALAEVVLRAGEGAGSFALGTGTPADLARQFGKPLEIAKVGRDHANHSVRGGLTVNFDAEGKANTIITSSGFGGRTAKGVRLWEPRSRVYGAYGQPEDQSWTARYWRYPGIVFYFDGFDRVERLVLFRPK